METIWLKQKGEMMKDVRVNSYAKNIDSSRPVERLARGFKSTLIYNASGVPLKASIRLKRLSVEDYYETPRIVMKDRDGKLVTMQLVDAVTGAEIGAGSVGAKYHRLLKNVEGRIVPSSEVRYFQILSDGSEMEISQFESNVGAGKELRVEAEISESEAERYLYESVYEINGEKDSDDEVLFSIAQSLVKNKRALIVVVVFRRSFKKSWGLIFADITGDSFNITMRVSRTKLEALHPMKVPREAFVAVEKPVATVVWEKKR